MTVFCVSTTPNTPGTPFRNRSSYPVSTIVDTSSTTMRGLREEHIRLVTINMHGRISVKLKYMVRVQALKLSFNDF